MKYTHKVKLKDGSYAYRFVAPKDAKLAGVVKNESFRDGRRARHEIPKLVQIVEDFRKGKVLAGNISINSNFSNIFFYNLFYLYLIINFIIYFQSNIIIFTKI